jgi:hypothetical protein
LILLLEESNLEIIFSISPSFEKKLIIKLTLVKKMSIGLSYQNSVLSGAFKTLAASTAKLEGGDFEKRDQGEECLRTISQALQAVSKIEKVLRASMLSAKTDLELASASLKVCSYVLGRIISLKSLPTFSQMRAKGDDLIGRVRSQFKQLLEKTYSLKDEEFTWHTQDSQLRHFYHMIQYFKMASPLANRFELKRIFYALSQADQTLFIDAFASLRMREEDKVALLKAKNIKLFVEIDRLKVDEASRNSLTNSLLQILADKAVFCADQLTPWILEQMLKRIDDFACAFEKMLLSKRDSLLEPEKVALNSHLRSIAIEDGVQVVDGDEEWGKYELQRDFPNSSWVFRLVRGLQIVDRGKRENDFQKMRRTCEERLGGEIAQYLFRYCPIVDGVRKGKASAFTQEAIRDLLSKGETIKRLEEHRLGLVSKYAQLGLKLRDPSHPLYRLWEEKKLGIASYPAEVSFENCKVKVDPLMQCLQCLATDNIDKLSAEMLLEVILKRYSFHPRQDQIQGEVDLREIQRRGLQQACWNQFEISEDSRCKSIYVISTNSTTIGKYKPNPPSLVAREVRGYVYDSILGLGMTPPTGFASFSMQNCLERLKVSFQRAEDKFRVAHELEKSNQLQLAKIYLDEAKELYRLAMSAFSEFPEEVKHGLYGYISMWFGYEHFEKGKSLWLESNQSDLTALSRARAIQDYLGSQDFQRYKINHEFETKGSVGSVQRWINGSLKRVIEFILEDPLAGEKLKAIPKAYVHLYCILGLLKGARDGFSGNALVTFSDDSSIKYIYEFDDEKSMPPENPWHQFRLWQFGLPQADQPFDRTLLMLFSRPDLLCHIVKHNQSDKLELISFKDYSAQESRISTMIDLFQKELKKSVLTLTPRDLFFTLTGGRENFEYWNKQEGLNPWHVFEHCMGEVGRGGYFCGENDPNKAVLDSNFKVLYAVKSEIEKLWAAVRSQHPKTCLIIKYDTGYGNNLYITGDLLGLHGWSQTALLKCIASDIWIFESDKEVLKGEYKIFFNKEVEEINAVKRSLLQGNIESRVVYPVFKKAK